MNRRSFIVGLGALLGTTALVKPSAPAIKAMTSTMDVACADSTVYWLSTTDFYLLRSSGEPESLFEALRDFKYDDPIYKSEIGRYLGFTFIESPPSAAPNPVHNENR